MIHSCKEEVDFSSPLEKLGISTTFRIGLMILTTHLCVWPESLKRRSKPFWWVWTAPWLQPPHRPGVASHHTGALQQRCPCTAVSSLTDVPINAFGKWCSYNFILSYVYKKKKTLMTTITTLEYGIWDKINLCFWVMAIQFGSGINSLIPFNVRTVCFVYFLPCFIITLMFLVGF